MYCNTHLVKIFEKNGLLIHLQIQTLNSTQNLLAAFVNNSSTPLTNFSFQVAVPKVLIFNVEYDVGDAAGECEWARPFQPENACHAGIHYSEQYAGMIVVYTGALAY